MFECGAKVDKVNGYSFPGTIVAKYYTLKGDLRYVVEMEDYGLQHIFNEGQLKYREGYYN